MQLVRNSDNKVIANLAFSVSNKNSLLSPLKGTFGGVSAKEQIDLFLLENFLNIAIFKILSNYKLITIKLNPLAYNARLCSKCINILSRIGFKITCSDLNYSLNLETTNFPDNISSGNKKKIRQCEKFGYIVNKLDVADYNKAYDVISKNRLQKKYKLSVNQEEFVHMVDLFENDIICFGVSHSDTTELVASSICIKISSDVLYVFYWGDILIESSFSPVALLATNIVQFAKDNNFKILDIGTSSINSVPLYSLANFKVNLGFEESLKFTMELSR